MSRARRRLLVLVLVALMGVAGGMAPATTVAQPGATVVVHDRIVGRSPRFVGANPGLTTAPNWEAWVRDSGMNAAREWANMEEIEPENEDGTYGNGVDDEAAFQAARAAVLAAPTENGYLAWPGFRFRDVDRRVGAYARHDITPVVVVRHSGSGSTRAANLPPWMANVPSTWPDRWEWWEFAFAVAYHTAREHGVSHFAVHSEPDRSVQGFTGRADDYVRLLADGADAIRAGVRSGMADRGRGEVAATIHAPGLAEPTARRGSFLRAVLEQAPVDVDAIDYHQYGPAQGGEFARRAEEVRSIAEAVGVPRPLFVSEYNISRSGERGEVDDPADALALAEAQRQLALAGVDGMLMYRFNFPSEFRNLSLVRSGPGSGRALVEETFGYQVFKHAVAGLAGGKDLLALDASGEAAWLATRDAERVHLLSVHRGGEALPVDLDLTALGIEGREALIRVAAAGRPNDILARPTVAGGRVSFVQPPASAVLVTVERGMDLGVPTSLRLEPLPESVARNRVRQLAALATFADGSEHEVSGRVAWRSADPATVRVNSSGLAVGVASGTTDVRACWGEICSEPVTVEVQ